MAKGKGVNGRAKGNRGEREICKLFRDALGGHWERKSMGIPGPDILTPEWFSYAIEVKNGHRDINAVHFFKPNKKLTDFWAQCSAQADALNLLPLLVVKTQGLWFACDSWGVWQTLQDWIVLYRKNEASKRERDKRKDN